MLVRVVGHCFTMTETTQTLAKNANLRPKYYRDVKFLEMWNQNDHRLFIIILTFNNLCVNQHDVSCHSTHVLKQIVHWKFSNPQQSLCSLYWPKASQHFNHRKAISKPEDKGTVNYNPLVRDTSWDKHVKAWVIYPRCV